MKPILSILIPSVPERQEMFFNLMDKLTKQIDYFHDIHKTLGHIEIVFDNSKRFTAGGLSIGKKREGLVRDATGTFLCFCDEDEDVAPNYVETLVRLCHTKPDVVTFRNISKMDNYWCVVDMSLKHKTNEQATPERIVIRRPWHICPVRSEYAKVHAFDDSNYGEDFTWMEKVLTHCKTETHTDAILHQYNHSSKTSEADKITNYAILTKS